MLVYALRSRCDVLLLLFICYITYENFLNDLLNCNVKIIV